MSKKEKFVFDPAAAAAKVAEVRSVYGGTNHRRVVAADIGKGDLWACVGGMPPTDAMRFHSLDELAAFLEPGDLLVCEGAHLNTPSKGRSKAQPYTAAELEAFHREVEEVGATLRFTAMGKCPRMRAFAARHFGETHGVVAAKKGDDNDTACIGLYVLTSNQIALGRPREDVEQRRAWSGYRVNVRKRANDTLNLSRDSVPFTEMPGVSEVVQEVMEMFEGETCPFITKEVGKGKNAHLAPNPKLFASIVACVVGPKSEFDDTPVLFTRNGVVPGWKSFKNHALRFNQFHFKSGVARSNVVHWTFRSAIVKFALNRYGVALKGKNENGNPASVSRNDFTPEQDAIMTEAWATFRRQLRRVYRAAVEVATSKGYEEVNLD